MAIEKKPIETALARHDAEAKADFAAGRVITHERMCDWLAKRLRGEDVPLPRFD